MPRGGFDDLPMSIRERLRVSHTGCWEWMKSTTARGYGQTTVEGKKTTVHRLVYQLLVGPIGAESLDHICRVRRCANPQHLEPVSTKENILRGVSQPAKNARKRTCPRCLGQYVLHVFPCGAVRRSCHPCRNAADRARRSQWTPEQRQVDSQKRRGREEAQQQ